MGNDNDKKKGEKGRRKPHPPVSQPYSIRNPGGRERITPSPFRAPTAPPDLTDDAQLLETDTPKGDGVVTEPLKGADTSKVVDQVLMAANKASSPRRAVEAALRSTEGRKRRTSSWPIAKYWEKIPTVWKALGIVAAIFVSGASGYAALQAYTDKYVTKSSYSEHLTENRETKKEIRLLRERIATQENSLSAVKKDLDSMREDVRTLLKHMLANPPPRPRGDSK